MKTRPVSVLKMVFMPSSARVPTSAKPGPRWSMTWPAIARRMRSGTALGPGIWRKCLPALRVLALLPPMRDQPSTFSLDCYPSKTYFAL
jgi:hypothetical protein